ncbi:hypothetical protein [Agrobacterium rosae]
MTDEDMYHLKKTKAAFLQRVRRAARHLIGYLLRLRKNAAEAQNLFNTKD